MRDGRFTMGGRLMFGATDGFPTLRGLIEPTITSNRFTPLQVSELIDEGTMSWNIDHITPFITDKDATAITAIPLNNHLEEDRLVWPFERDGGYSVKTGYHCIRSNTVLPTLNRSSSSHSVDCKTWKLCWDIKTIPKISNFMWRALNNSLPTFENLWKRKVTSELKPPLPKSEILLPVLPPLEPSDLPPFVSDFGSYPAAYKLVVVEQFSNVDKADMVLCNSFYELEDQVVDWMAKVWPLKTIGPTIPSKYLDKRLEDDKDYGFNMFKPNNDACMKWLNEQPKGSILYVSFGSGAEIEAEQMKELAWGMRRSKSKFLWVVREAEAAKVPEGFIEETSEKGLVVSWCSQPEVLAHEAVGCFITHCGWNSTLEALSLGVPLVAMPQWTDQRTNAKYIKDVLKIGVKAQPDEKGIVRQEEIEHCISEIMEGERGKEIHKNAMKWKVLAGKAVDEGGRTDKNIDEFIANLVRR